MSLGTIVTLASVAFTIVGAAVGLLARTVARQTRQQDQLTHLTQEITEVAGQVNRQQEQMDRRVRWLEENRWDPRNYRDPPPRKRGI